MQEPRGGLPQGCLRTLRAASGPGVSVCGSMQSPCSPAQGQPSMRDLCVVLLGVAVWGKCFFVGLLCAHAFTFTFADTHAFTLVCMRSR